MTDDPSSRRNRLSGASSPYLLQHADNPVHWYPWSAEAFESARRQDKPVFLSIGYSTCHWCHVMAHESFEDPEVARLMNETFVNIKVDREERPDVDQIYMTVCQMLTGSGGWPLTILMTPDRRPFHAATYIPRESRYGRPGMLDLVPRVHELWRRDRERLLGSADELLGHLRRIAAGGSPQAVDPAAAAEAALRDLAGRYDARHGGFGSAPKFPTPHNLLFLLQERRAAGDDEALAMVERTLRSMRYGGVYDHLGFGFHRYATDREWLVPHFEKMLYDQALHVLALVEAHRATADARYARWAREVLEYVRRDMTHPDGGFYSAEDADSEGEEGRFYVWTLDEVRGLLDDSDARLAAEVWNLRKEGNWTEEATGRPTGTNIPWRSEPLEVVASRHGVDESELRGRLERIRGRLFAARERRPHPLKDDKILADWNGLMAAAAARAGRILDDAPLVDGARRALDFVDHHLRTPDGALLHRYRDGDAAVPAFLDDHAFLAWGHLEVHDATLDGRHLRRAMELMEDALDELWDTTHGGFYFSRASEELLVRPKEGHDGAIPSGNAVAAWCLVRLSRLTGRPELEQRAAETAAAFAVDLARAPSAHTHLVAALRQAAAPSLEVVLVGEPGAEDTVALLNEVRARQPRHASVLLVPPGRDGQHLRDLAPFTGSFETVGGKATAYLCHDFRCELPTSDPEELGRRLDEAGG